MDLQMWNMKDNLTLSGIPEQAGEDSENIQFIQKQLKLAVDTVKTFYFHCIYQLGGKKKDNYRLRLIINSNTSSKRSSLKAETGS